MSGTFDVVVLGSLHLDIMVEAPRLPRLGETLAGRSWQLKCGGKGGNQAVAAARQGARTAMVGRVGEDDFGRRLLEGLRDAGVDTMNVSTDPAAASGASVAIVEDAGDYAAVILSAANLRLDDHEVTAALGLLGSGSVLLLQNEVPDSVNRQAAATARRMGTTTILNAAPARPLEWRPDVLVVNAVEAEMLDAGPVSDLASASRAAIRLADRGGSVIVTAGADGLAYAQGGGVHGSVAGYRVVVSDTHGAGDMFVGALASCIAAGRSLAEAVRWANAAAAVHVSTPRDERDRSQAEVIHQLLRSGT